MRRYADLELKRAARQERFFLEHYGPQLEAWTRKRIADSGGQLKRVRLPAGSIGVRAVDPKLIVTDEQALLNWCRTHLPTAIAQSERVLKTTINHHLRATGEYPDGTQIAPGGDHFYIS